MSIDRARANREKVARFEERKRIDGMKKISAYIGKDARAAMDYLKGVAREVGEPCTNGDIVGMALNALAIKIKE
jgi:hypothetical protein